MTLSKEQDWNIGERGLLCWSHAFMVNSSNNCIQIEWLVGGVGAGSAAFPLCNELVEGLKSANHDLFVKGCQEWQRELEALISPSNRQHLIPHFKPPASFQKIPKETQAHKQDLPPASSHTRKNKPWWTIIRPSSPVSHVLFLPGHRVYWPRNKGTAQKVRTLPAPTFFFNSFSPPHENRGIETLCF